MERPEEQWTDDLLYSLDGLQPATADPRLFNGILLRMQKAGGAQVRQLVPLRVVLAAAASFALLLTLNWQVIEKRTGRPAPDQQAELLANQYGTNSLTLYQD